MWKKRNLTVLGKITVVKTILLSKLTHLFISLPSPSKVYIKALETIFYNYILKGKRNYTSHIYQIIFILYEPILYKNYTTYEVIIRESACIFS